MKKFIMIIFILFVCLIGSILYVSMEYFQRNQDIFHLGINAEILSINDEKKSLLVKIFDKEQLKIFDKEQSFSESCILDCSQIQQIIYCDYESGEVTSIPFSELQEGDSIILGFYDSGIHNDEKTYIIQVQQIQLAEQRISFEGITKGDGK